MSRTTTGSADVAERGDGRSERIERYDRSPVGIRTLLLGTASGAAAALLGYLVTYALLVGSARSVLVRHGPQYSIARDVFPEFAGSIPVWKAIGWLFYEAHGAGVRFQEVGHGGGNFLHFLAYEGGLYAWLWVLPASLLVVAGAVVASRSGDRGIAGSALAGATVAVGYALVLLAGTAVLSATLGGVRIDPELSILAIVGFPVLFGAVGGVVGGVSLPSAVRR